MNRILPILLLFVFLLLNATEAFAEAFRTDPPAPSNREERVSDLLPFLSDIIAVQDS